MSRKIVIGIIYGFAFLAGIFLLFLSTSLICKCIICLDFFNGGQKNCDCSSNTIFLTVMATSTVGTAASIFQIITLLKSLIASHKEVKENSAKKFTDLKTHIEKNCLLLDEISSFNKLVKTNFSYSKMEDKFNIQISYDDYQSIIFNSFLGSNYLYKLVGESTYIKNIQNNVTSAQPLLDDLLLSKVGENLKLLFEESCRKIDDLLCSYYSGHINLGLFKKFESSYLIELISKLKFYIVLTYERDRSINSYMYNYKFLIKYLKDIIIKRNCFIWE